MCCRFFFPQSLLGVSYSLLACALWPMVAFVVPEHQLGTAYGLYVPLIAMLSLISSIFTVKTDTQSLHLSFTHLSLTPDL